MPPYGGPQFQQGQILPMPSGAGPYAPMPPPPMPYGGRPNFNQQQGMVNQWQAQQRAYNQHQADMQDNRFMPPGVQSPPPPQRQWLLNQMGWGY